MATRRRRRFTADFKKRVALEALRGDRTVQEIAARHEVHPNQVSTWKRQAIDGLDEIFGGGRTSRQSEHEATVRDLHAKIGHRCREHPPSAFPPSLMATDEQSRKEHELDQQAENDRTVPELEQLHVGFQLGFDPADLGRQARVKVRNFGSHLSDLGRQARVKVRDLGPHLGLAGLELVGGDVIALLGGQAEGIGEGVSLGGREVGSGQRPGNSMCVEHRANPSHQTPLRPSGIAGDDPLPVARDDLGDRSGPGVAPAVGDSDRGSARVVRERGDVGSVEYCAPAVSELAGSPPGEGFSLRRIDVGWELAVEACGDDIPSPGADVDVAFIPQAGESFPESGFDADLEHPYAA